MQMYEWLHTYIQKQTGWPAYSDFQNRNSGIFILPQRAHTWANEALYEDVLSETATGTDANVCKKKKGKGEILEQSDSYHTHSKTEIYVTGRKPVENNFP